jgi:DNA-binding XRE family transcriptional regulator
MKDGGMVGTDRTGEQILERIQGDPVASRAYHDQQAMAWLGRTLRQARENAGLSQTRAAARAGMTQGELSRVENGLPVKGVTFTTLVGLSEALGFDIVFELHAPGTHQAVAQQADEHAPLPLHLAVREIA